MNNRITKFLAITLFLLNISLVAKGEAVDAVTGATPVKLKIEANVDKQLDLYVFMGKRPHLSFHRKLKPGMPVALSNMAGYKNIRNGRPII